MTGIDTRTSSSTYINNYSPSILCSPSGAMKLLPAIVFAFGLLLVLNAAGVESAGRGIGGGAGVESAGRSGGRLHHLFVFGDSFGDNGNLRRTQSITRFSRQWHWPYGVYHNVSDGAQLVLPTGRFSNYRVQSDIVANMLGHDEAPPAYESRAYRDGDGHPSGVTFAVGGAGVYRVPHRVATLSDQIDNFESLINDGTITDRRLDHSVALIAISGNDYARVGVNSPDMSLRSFGDVTAFIRNVTTEIAANVNRLQSLGVRKILVNNLHPVGCTPAQTRQSSYGGCDDDGNMGVSAHNDNLQQKLSDMEDVHIVDLHAAFSNIINSNVGEWFGQKLAPCCEPSDPNGFCGETGGSPEDLRYSVCDNPDDYLFWDEMHPTNAGWEAVMAQLQYRINDFLGLID